MAIDIGNTNIVIGCINRKKNVFIERLSTVRTKTELEYAIDIKNVLDIYCINPDMLEGGIISSVVPQITEMVMKAAEKILHKKVMVVGKEIRTGIDIQIDNPDQLGSDLIVDSVAAVDEYTSPLLIFDMGTATTVCVIDKNKVYRGGMIYPGAGISLDSLIAHASRLGGIGIEEPGGIIGKNTEDCMKSGIIYSNASAIDGIIERMQDEFCEDITVVATGGLSEKIVPYCRKSVILDKNLLLKGLEIIYLRNKY